jgi:folate-dependent phosphoribosylglycinamide formyltransferase PurN
LNATHGWDIEPFVISKEDYPKGPGPRNWDFTDEQSDAMLGICQRFGVGTIVLLGLTSRVRGSLFEAYGSLPSHKSMFDAAAINTHPGVVELTRGLHGFEVHERMWQLAQDGEIDYTEQTVHVVTAGYDEGATFRRNRVGILPAYSAKDVEAAVQAREKATIAGDTYDFAREREAYLANAA